MLLRAIGGQLSVSISLPQQPRSKLGAWFSLGSLFQLQRAFDVPSKQLHHEL
jgi:hypothetical protein